MLAFAIAGVAGLVCLIAVAAGFYRVAKLVSGTGTGLAGEGNVRLHEEVVEPGAPGASGKIAVVDIKGIIVSDTRFDAASAKRICAELRAVGADPEVDAVILDMNSPGGEVTASDEIYHEVMKLRAKGTPVITCMHALGASGGYLVAAGTDYIVASRLTLTGSVGVIIGTLNYAKLFEKIGLESEVYKSGDMKDFLNGGRLRTEPEKEYTNALVRETYEEFVRIVAAGRSRRFGSVQDVLRAEFADGRVLTGRKALAAGLIDAEGYFEDAVRKARELGHAPDAPVVRVRQTFRLSDLFFALETEQFHGLWGLLPPEARLVKPGQLYFLLPAAMP